MTLRQALAIVATRFLPFCLLFGLLPLVAEPLIRHHNVMDSLGAVYVPLAIGEPVLITAGFAIVFAALRRHLTASSLRGHAMAALVAVVLLGLTSTFTQGAHLPFIIVGSILAGAVAAGVVFGLPALRALMPSSPAA